VAKDVSGSGHDATLHEAQWVRLRDGFALSLPSKSSYADAGPNVTARFSARTIEAWIKPDSVRGKQAIVAKWCPSGNQRSFMLFLQDDRVVFWLSPDGALPRVRSLASTLTVDATRWHHVAATWDGKTMRLFIDGKQDPATATIDRVFESTTSVLIGRYQTGYYYRGLIDDVRLHARALTASEIGSHAELGRE